MNAAGQAMVEFILLTLLFLVVFSGIIRRIPNTFSESTPYLGATLQNRIETGGGFNRERLGGYNVPEKPRGGIKD